MANDPTPMTLGEARRLFTKLLFEWGGKMVAVGYQMEISEVTRGKVQAAVNGLSPTGKKMLADMLDRNGQHTLASLVQTAPTGIATSLHCDGLAADVLVIMPDGKLAATAEDYRPLGDAWKAMDPRCCWGGDFGDADHFSISYGGRK